MRTPLIPGKKEERNQFELDKGREKIMKKALSLTLAGVMLAGALTGCGNTGSSSAQGGSDGASLDYPKNDVQIVIPYAPGGGSEVDRT